MWQRGGAGLLADLVSSIAAGIGGGTTFTIRQLNAPKRAAGRASGHVGPENETFHHSTALWLPHEYEPQNKELKDPPKAWRVEEFLGVRRSQSARVFGRWARVNDDDPHACIVVLDDAALGFRDHEELWPASLTEAESRPWIVVKTSRPIAEGPLWKHLCAHHSDRVIAVMTANDLRLTNVQLSRELSWERTAQDLAWEMHHNDRLEGLRRCAHVVVLFNAAGAFLCSRDKTDALQCTLLFDPMVIEGVWEQQHPGQMVGYSSCLVTGIVHELMLDSAAPDINRGILKGVHAMRALHREGYGVRGAKAAEVRLTFPEKQVAGAFAVDKETLDAEFATVPVPLPVASRNWTFLGLRYPDEVEKIAAKVVEAGADKVLKGVPFGIFGALTTVDRQEMESLRSIGALASEYLAQEKPKRPLSVAAFGPPGAGKSFGITELARSLRPGGIEVREFNMSQLRSIDELLSAFHQVRDVGLSGKIPLIFWDEFDSAFDGPFGWLKYFLAPMQDGKFLHGNLPHPVGRAIFVFAGGTSPTLQEFGRGLDPEIARAAKLPDFVSRLKGYINVLGPNPVQGRDDPHCCLRRAILLRSMLKRDAPQIESRKKLQIDSGVLRALIETTRYKHGARSMESIIAMCRLEGKTSFERSALPAPAQLDLHVDGMNFLALVHQPEGKRLELMAEETHKIYCEQQKNEGWKYGPAKNEDAKTNPLLVDYDKLSEEDKEQNRDQVRNIFRKLEHAGCSMAPAKERAPLYKFAQEMVEELASLEHTRWMRMKARKGWRYADKRVDREKLHNCMLPWKAGELSDYVGFEDVLGTVELPEKEKEKDRETVINIPRILNKGGYTILPPPRDLTGNQEQRHPEFGKEFPARVLIHPKTE